MDVFLLVAFSSDYEFPHLYISDHFLLDAGHSFTLLLLGFCCILQSAGFCFVTQGSYFTSSGAFQGLLL